jgi:hypothetical protein
MDQTTQLEQAVEELNEYITELLTAVETLLFSGVVSRDDFDVFRSLHPRAAVTIMQALKFDSEELP